MAKKIKIGFLIDQMYSDAGGTEKQLLEIIKRLDRSLFSPYLICLRSTEWIETAELPCPHLCLGFRGFMKPDVMKPVAAFRRLLTEQRFHIVQTFFEDSLFFCFLATRFMSSRPLLISSRRDIGLVERPWYHRLYRLALPLVNQCFDGIVANGRNIRKHVSAHERVPVEKIAVVPNGIDLPADRYEIPTLFTERMSPLWIGIVANLSPVKRIDVFVDALRRLKDDPEVPAFRAVHLGEGPELERVRALSERYGLEDRLFFEGSVTNVGAYLSRIDIAVLCSDREGLSNSILEYMSHYLPVVATAVGGNTELVDESNGFCVPPGDSGALAVALKTLILNPAMRASLGRNSRMKVETVYSWETSMREWQDYYSHLVRA